MTAKLKNKKSKRISTRTRNKVIKKVAEHKRKQRKDEKKNPQKYQKKKERFVIPNNAPFKERLMAEYAVQQVQAEEQREKDALKRKRQRAEVKKLKAKYANPELRAAELEKQVAKDQKKAANKKGPATAALIIGTYSQVIEASDVIVEVLDARDPLATRCAELEEMVTAQGSSKRLVLLLNKTDLVPRSCVEKWVQYLSNEYPTVPFRAVQTDLKANSKVPHKETPWPMVANNIKKCVGITMFKKMLENYRLSSGKAKLTVGFVGFPNTGKSSVVNTMASKPACATNTFPGFTESLQKVQLNRQINLLDGPAVMPAFQQSNVAAALLNFINLKEIQKPVPAVEAFISQVKRTGMSDTYTITDYTDAADFLKKVGERWSHIKPCSAELYTNKVARIVLQDWTRGKIRHHTSAPASSVPESQVVADMMKEFKMEDLAQELKDIYCVVPEKNVDEDHVVESVGTFTPRGEDEEEEMEEDSDDDEEEESDDDEEESDDDDDEEEMEEDEDEDDDDEEEEEEVVPTLVEKKAKKNGAAKVTKKAKDDDDSDFDFEEFE